MLILSYNYFMKIHVQDKTKLVNSVFTKVHKRYDFMNDVMSLGIHRLWKKNMIDWMRPQENSSLIDIASVTGDIAKIFSQKTNNKSQIFCIEPNKEMMKIGQLIGMVLKSIAKNPEELASVEAEVKKEVITLCKEFPLYSSLSYN